MTNQERFDIHQHITDQIVAAIERGAGEFRLPWHRSAGNIMRPVNVVSKKTYRGVNILALWATAEEKSFTSGATQLFSEEQSCAYGKMEHCMTRKSQSRLNRERRKIPRHDNIASVTVDHDRKKVIFTTSDMLVKQLHRDGPRVAESFDRLTKTDIEECSAVFGQVQSLLLRHLSRLDSADFKATATRLLFSASNSLVASIEVARHGYPRQYGAVARVLIETLATVIVLAIKNSALEEFHAGTLDSTKCLNWSKDVLPPLGRYWGMLSNEFVHIGKGHSNFEGPSVYTDKSEALSFIIATVRGHVWLLHVVADLIFSDETDMTRYWRRNGQEAWFEPTFEMREWIKTFLALDESP